MTDWVFLTRDVVLALHEAQLIEHGGLAGFRDEGALDLTLARPLNILAYGDPSVFDLAATYAFGFVRNHVFSDGNKRISLVVTETFLLLNGYELIANDPSTLRTWLDLAEGSLNESALSAWLRENSAPV